MTAVLGRQLVWTVGINLVAFGAHLCSCGCFVYLPPLLRKAGFSEQTRGAILGLGPFLCMLGVPLVGAWSDSCRSPLGRRRPFLLGIGLLLCASLVCIAFSDGVAQVFGAEAQKVALAAATVLLDFASQALHNPTQALICDLVPDVDFGFAVYSFALSLGGVFGYLLSALDWTGTSLGQGGQERAVFLLLLLAFIICLALTVLLAKEKPLVSKQLSRQLPLSLTPVEQEPFLTDCNGWTPLSEPGTPSHGNKGLVHHLRKAPWHKMAPAEAVRNALSASLVLLCDAFCRVFISFPTQLAHWLQLANLVKVPLVLRKLFVFHLLAWMAVMSHYLYFTDFTGEVIFRGRPEESATLADRTLYDEGVRAGSWGLLVNCVASSIYSLFFQWRITARYGQKTGLLIGVGTFAAAMPGMLFFNGVTTMIVLSAITGIASAALDSIPYALASTYCANKQEYFSNSKFEIGTAQCLAVLNTAEYLSQVLLSLFMGYTFYATGTVASYIHVAVVCALAACYASCHVTCASSKK